MSGSRYRIKILLSCHAIYTLFNLCKSLFEKERKALRVYRRGSSRCSRGRINGREKVHILKIKTNQLATAGSLFMLFSIPSSFKLGVNGGTEQLPVRRSCS